MGSVPKGWGGETHGLFAAIDPVPEPSGLALLAAAFGVAVRRSRTRRQSAERRLEPPPSIVMIEPVV
jgi:PEP-CTERM motif